VILGLALGALGCATAPPPPPPRPTPRPAALAPVEGVARAEGVLRTIPLRDGRTLTLRADGAFTRGRGEVTDARLTVRDPEGCALRPWGERGIALCPAEGPVGSFFGADSPWLGQFRGALSAVIPGRDGRTLTRDGSCEARADHDAARESVVCTWDEPRGWRAWTVDRPDAHVLDVFDQRALLRWTERTELPGVPAIAHEVVGLYDIDRGRWLPLTPEDPTARWACAGFDDDGRVRGIVHTGTAAAPRAWRMLGGDASEGAPRLQARPLPFAAEDFGALDDLRMVLVRGAEAVAMRDPERAAPVRSTEALENPRRVHATRCGERVVCGGERCVVDGRVTVSLPAPRDPLAP
jgi:hypothetical protein